ncbi:MAG TPA: hypothetical protein DHU69_04555 [Deltaproteobacteria bacterium]|nr:MAG: hypothetical protein A2056_03075 [Deltaproteobacteria bacterium GWA2_42_85]OGP43477.1 MAG: hypothetical protein A2090_04370 [Deltaproteobacteria bacterium GWD2_42_10]OGP46027.1 MAG: hypothetical protein A2022_04070 [Deltaproteobacteria bacterium GWF2_42_12]OGQ27543.1 MAG: hypothetical protein A3D29_08495 [Deltaproteobacteria bacterium RIFCSPHIGHO2_02_FULL_42_44]OGQ35879.1 MAG: hypothetical protein A3H47_05440 [Deltaproteobacteria bacterium RIFCSPLOWO2_02_FULL_42_39]OGQ68398.1 MAG: hypo
MIEKDIDRIKAVEQKVRIRNWQIYAVSLSLMVCLLLVFFPSFALPKSSSNNNFSQSELVKNVAILPLENLSEDSAATGMFREFIKKELNSKGWIHVKEEDTVEKFLAKRRIRYTGGITRVLAREMGKILGVDAVLVGSINQFSDTMGKVNVGVTARLIGTDDGSIIWADTLSYSGHDFEGILGFGIITSTNILGSKVAKGLMEDISDKTFTIKGTNLRPFELEKIEAQPTVVRGGDKVWIRIKMLAISEEPVEVKAVIDNVEFELVLKETGGYEGYVAAPSAESVYPVSVIARDKADRAYIFDATGKIVVDTTPPKIELNVSNKVFSPQKKGSVLFTPRLMSVDDIDEWVIEIFDKEGNKVRSDRGYSKLPKGLIWRGETDKLNRVGDGEYVYKFTTKDVAGNETFLTDSVRVKNQPPAIKVDIDKVEDKVLFSFAYSHDENIKSWKLSILDRDGKTIQTMEGDGELPPKIDYLVEQGFDIRKMLFSVTAVDVVDNVFTLTKPIWSILSKKAPLMKSNGNGNGNGNGKGHLAEDF